MVINMKILTLALLFKHNKYSTKQNIQRLTCGCKTLERAFSGGLQHILRERNNGCPLRKQFKNSAPHDVNS